MQQLTAWWRRTVTARLCALLQGQCSGGSESEWMLTGELLVGKVAKLPTYQLPTPQATPLEFSPCLTNLLALLGILGEWKHEKYPRTPISSLFMSASHYDLTPSSPP